MNELLTVLIVVVVFHPFCFGWKSLFRVHRFVTPRPLFDNRRSSSTDEYLMKKRFQKLTKQVATIGPSSLNVETVERMFLSGADVFRINLSHGEHHEKGAAVDMVREVEKKYNRPIAVIADLQGPRLRLGSFENEKVTVVDNQQFVFDLNEELGSAYRVRLPHPELLKSLKIGEVLLVDDGKIRLEVVNNSFLGDDATRDVNPTLDPATSCQEVSPRVTCKVLVGGVLSDKKGVNAPDTVLPISSLTPKDKRDLKFALEKNVDWVALSFVQRPEDILELRSLTGDQVKIMSKLEKPSAISQHLEKIIALSDGIMVARGDLGIECPPWDVPVLQKRIVQKCKEFGKPVIVATQMLDSMIDHPVPTRAEASDCATAIYDTSDAVMLSGESAAGRYPVDAVKMQLNIITSVESDDFYRRNLGRFAKELSSKGGFTFPEKRSRAPAALLGEDESMLMQENTTPLPDDVSTVANVNEPCSVATTLAARQVAEISGSKAILTITKTGSIVHRISRLRPNVPIIAACYNERVARYLSLLWGVYPVVLTPPAQEFHFTTEMERACQAACALGFCDPSKDFLTVIAGLPFGIPHTTNFIRVCSAAGPRSWPSPLPNGRLRDETSTSDVA